MTCLDPVRRLALPGGPGWVLSFSVVVDPGVGPAVRLLDGVGRELQRMDRAAAHPQHVVWPLDGDGLVLEVAPPGVARVQVTDAVVYGPDVLRTGVLMVDLDADPPTLRDPAEVGERFDADPWRPAYHFCALRGWLNDPNGLVADGERTHLFFQANPHGPDWGTMHWGHAVSEDLVHWRHLPTALYPADELTGDPSVFGGAFSGSALVIDGGVRLFYTSHLQARGGTRFEETQEWAALCDGVHAEPRGTLIGAPPGPSYGRDFRDPKVWREEDGGYAMVLGSRHDGAPCVLLYRSADALDWTFDGVLYREQEIPGWTIECPDFFALDGTHVLVAGLLGSEDSDTAGRHLSYAWLGRYDGRSFVVDSRHELDAGPDLYAMQTFLRNGRRYAMAWMDDWRRSYPTKPSGWAGTMALPRELHVRGGRLHQRPVEELAQLRAELLVDLAGPPAVPVPVPGSLLEIELRLGSGSPSGSIVVRLTNDVGEDIAVAYAADGTLVVTSHCGQDPPGHAAAEAQWHRLGPLRIFVDRSSIEVFVDDGALCLTTTVYPVRPWQRLQVSSEPGICLDRLRVWRLRRAWPGEAAHSGQPTSTGQPGGAPGR